jgi:glycosyltransferase involved in cell wall biosynthesis
MEPLVSIGMSVFNCEHTLNIAVQSILNQTYSNWELILIDDGSQDRTLEIAKSFQDPRIKVLSDSRNRRLPIRLNQAIALSSGKYFARMDGDDVSYPERLQRQVEYLEHHPEIDLLGTANINFNEDGQVIGIAPTYQSHAEICDRPWSSFMLLHPTWMGKLDWFQKYRYRSDAIRIEDYDLMLRTYQASRFASLPDVLLGYRVSSLSLKKSLTSRYYLCSLFLQTALRNRNWIFAYAVLEQIAKSLVEIISVAAGLGYKLLQHRIGTPINNSDLAQWQQIWSQCNQKDRVLPKEKEEYLSIGK